MRKIIKLFAPILMLGGAIVITVILVSSKPKPEKTIEPPRPLSLYVEPARAETITFSVSTQGEVRAKTNVLLMPEVSGRIMHVSENFSEGGAFKAGETLVQIDDTDYRLAFTRAESQVAEASVKLEQELADARIKEKQWKEWVKDGEPTPLALNKPQVAQAEAAMRAAEANLASARLSLERTRISLPFSGRIAERMISTGQLVGAGSQLGRAFATNQVEIKLPLTDKQLAELNLPVGYVAQNIGPKVTFSAIVGGAEHHWTGHVKRINASIDKETRLYYAIAEVNDPYGAGADQGMPLAIGLFVRADIEGVTPRETLILPRTALRSDGFVYVVNKDNKLEIRKVDVLASNEQQIMLGTSGIKAGEQVVISPVHSPVEGMDVLAVAKQGANKAQVAQAPGLAPQL